MVWKHSQSPMCYSVIDVILNCSDVNAEGLSIDGDAATESDQTHSSRSVPTDTTENTTNTETQCSKPMPLDGEVYFRSLGYLIACSSQTIRP